jgi:hypothetical protein
MYPADTPITGERQAEKVQDMQKQVHDLEKKVD